MKYLSISIVTLLVACFLFNSSLEAKAQDLGDKKEELKISLQVRPRAEMRNGVFTPILENQDPAFFVTQRNRLGVNYRTKKFSTGINLQMLNVWGSELQVQRTATSVSVYEAWGQLQLSKTTRIKVGRQVFSYDDERILGALNWNQAGRKHDAMLFGINKKRFKLDAVVAFNQNRENIVGTIYNDSASQPYKSMQFIWAKFLANDALSFSTLAMNLGMQNTTDTTMSYMQTMGINAFYKKKKIAITASFYYQLGTTQSTTAALKTNNAWMASVYATYSATKNFGIRAGSDYLTGRDMNSTSSENNAFNPLYGTHHKFYGYMDYFYVASPHNNVGLWDSYLAAIFKIKKNTDIQFAYHHFNSAAQIVTSTGNNASSNLGDEFDLTFSHNIAKAVKLVGGYSQMLPSSSLDIVKNITPAQNVRANQSWLWMSLIITPQITIK